MGSTTSDFSGVLNFFVFVFGCDFQVRKHLAPRFSTSSLTSTKILSQRSAVPPVFSRATSTNAADRERKRKMTREEKDKLLKIAKRPRKGPFNSVLDPTEYEAGSGVVELSKAVKESGTYDPWAVQEESEGEDLVPRARKVKVRSPRVSLREIQLLRGRKRHLLQNTSVIKSRFRRCQNRTWERRITHLQLLTRNSFFRRQRRKRSGSNKWKSWPKSKLRWRRLDWKGMTRLDLACQA